MSAVLIRTSSSSSTSSARPRGATGRRRRARCRRRVAGGSALTGSHSSTVVPWPGALRDRQRRRRAARRGRAPWRGRGPVPLPMPLVEKNGSTARGERRLVHADAGVGDRRGGRSGPAAARPTVRRPARSRARRAMVSVPPSGMASRAFTARLRSAISSWLGSAWAGGRSAASVRPAPRSRARACEPIRSAMPVDQRGHVDRASACSGWRRAKASRRCTSVLARSADCSAPSISRRSRSLPTPARHAAGRARR